MSVPLTARTGSPPRAWGPLVRGGQPAALRRFTPTRVGTTWLRISSGAGPSVHPHARGDHASVSLPCFSIFGSPPRAWGPLCHLRERSGARRFTPTRVGTTSRWARSTLPAPVHPHARGDHCRQRAAQHLVSGSPPRAWGPHTAHDKRMLHNRFTPTRVGTTPSRQIHQTVTAVHPHARGDHWLRFSQPISGSGSPPRAWGPPGGVTCDVTALRFTPTRVGTTHSRKRL